MVACPKGDELAGGVRSVFFCARHMGSERYPRSMLQRGWHLMEDAPSQSSDIGRETTLGMRINAAPFRVASERGIRRPSPSSGSSHVLRAGIRVVRQVRRFV